MGKNLKDMTRQEQAAYFKSKDFCGEELKIVMDAISYGISADYLQLFEDTTLSAETMENMFTAMKEDYGVEAASFLSAIHQGETGRIILEALKSGIPLHALKEIYQKDMLPIELREKILPLMQERELLPEKFGEKVQFITEAVWELKESLSRQNRFIEDLKKSMEEKPDIFSEPQKGAAAEAGADMAADAYYLELEEQFRQAREDAERLLEEREGTNKRLRDLEAENRRLNEEIPMEKMIKTLRTKTRIQTAQSPAIRQAAFQIEIKISIRLQKRKEEMGMLGKKANRSSRPAMRHPLLFLLPLGCAALLLLAHQCWKQRKAGRAACDGCVL